MIISNGAGEDSGAKFYIFYMTMISTPLKFLYIVYSILIRLNDPKINGVILQNLTSEEQDIT